MLGFIAAASFVDSFSSLIYIFIIVAVGAGRMLDVGYSIIMAIIPIIIDRLHRGCCCRGRSGASGGCGCGGIAFGAKRIHIFNATFVNAERACNRIRMISMMVEIDG